MLAGTTAHKQGRVASDKAVGGDRVFEGAVSTQVVKVFDLAIALLAERSSRFGQAIRHAVTLDRDPIAPRIARAQAAGPTGDGPKLRDAVHGFSSHYPRVYYV